MFCIKSKFCPNWTWKFLIICMQCQYILVISNSIVLKLCTCIYCHSIRSYSKPRNFVLYFKHFCALIGLRNFSKFVWNVQFCMQCQNISVISCIIVLKLCTCINGHCISSRIKLHNFFYVLKHFSALIGLRIYVLK